MIAPVILLVLALAQALPSGAVLHGEERRGAVLARLEGAPALSWQACASACGYQEACQAWTHNAWPARCTLHNAPLTPRPYPGAVTGLSPSLAARIERSIERAPSQREQDALGQPRQGGNTVPDRLPANAQSQLFPER